MALRLARIIALAIPALLLGGAYVSQYVFGLYPCEMCWWQRYPHFVALAFALLAWVRPGAAGAVGLSGLAIAVSGLIGAFHAGVEYGWWEGFTACTSLVDFSGGSALDAVMSAPKVRCDEVQWALFGISLAGWNFLISAAAALTIFLLLRRARRRLA